MRHLVLATFVTCAWPFAAHAQWAASRIEHDWCLTIGNQSFGLVQTAVYITDLEHVNHRETTLRLGSFAATSTRYRADAVVLIVATLGGLFLVRRSLMKS